MQFNVSSYCVTEGQPAEKQVECKMAEDGMSWKLTIKAGRQGSETVAQWFKEQISKNGDTRVSGTSVACDSYDMIPTKLNFAYRGDLYIEYYDTILNKKLYLVGKDIVIAQGHNARSRNNWWIGGANMRNVVDIKIALWDLKGIAQIFNVEKDGIIEVLSKQLFVFSEMNGSENRFAVTVVGL